MEKVREKIHRAERITPEECLELYSAAALPELGVLANAVRERKNGRNAYFNRNVHIEPTNICVNRCRFCSYRRAEGEAGSWDLGVEDMLKIARSFQHKNITEIHVVGGVHPRHPFSFYESLIEGIHSILPHVHIKAFTAEELWKMSEQSGKPVEQVLARLQGLGLRSIPGGGAEILNDEVRSEICAEKIGSAAWLHVHEQAHRLGITSNATMLYGHVERYEHRVEHLAKLRDLQDKTGGFNAFIPLKFRRAHNALSDLGEVTAIEDLRNMAICRIFLDNIPHLKAYWPMFGKSAAQLALSFGADDLDGTIGDSTKIYSMAGADDKNPHMSVDELCEMVRSAGFTPVERNSLYHPVKQY
jgi:aminodeoxyfutalosine synthase